MAAGSYQQRGTWKTSCGRLKRFYAKYQRPDGFWLTGGGTDSEDELAGLIERVRAKNPGHPIRVIEYRGGERIEGVALDPTPAAAAA